MNMKSLDLFLQMGLHGVFHLVYLLFFLIVFSFVHLTPSTDMLLRNAIIGVIFLASWGTAQEHIIEADLGETVIAFEPTEDSSAYRLVAYVHPEDEVSQAIEPEWLQVQKSASPSTSDFKDGTIVKIDCTEEVSKKWCQKERIKSFPTIRLYRNDVPGSLRYERYRGPPKAAAILGFLRRSLQPVVSMVDEKNITEFSKRDDVVFVGRIPGQENGKPSQAEGLFQAAAVKYRDRFSFALEVDGAKGREPSVSCWNNLDGLKHETTQLQTRELLEKFIELCSTPLIPEMTRRNELGFYETRKSIVHYFTSNEQEQQEYVKEMRPLAKKYHEYLHFTTTDVNEYPEAPEMMGFKWGYSTGLSVQNPNNGDIYPYTRSQPLSARAVELFLSDIIQGKVKPLAADTGGDTGARGGQQGRREHEEL